MQGVTTDNEAIEHLNSLNLQSLALDGYSLEDLLPALENLGSLQKLCLSEAEITPSNIKFISKNKNLSHLELIEMDMHTKACKYIYDMENLKVLSLDCCEELGKGCLTGISKLKNLETLNISGVSFGKDEFAEISLLSNLNELTISCRLTPEILNTLKHMPSLQKLNYEGKALSLEQAVELSSLKSLKVLEAKVASDEVRETLKQSGIVFEDRKPLYWLDNAGFDLEEPDAGDVSFYSRSEESDAGDMSSYSGSSYSFYSGSYTYSSDSSSD